jgi:hypothetical protein
MVRVGRDKEYESETPAVQKPYLANAHRPSPQKPGVRVAATVALVDMRLRNAALRAPAAAQHLMAEVHVVLYGPAVEMVVVPQSEYSW